MKCWYPALRDVSGPNLLAQQPHPARKNTVNQLSSEVQQQLFVNARTFSAWLPQQVSDELLKEIYELMKWGPTSANTSPARFVFVKPGPSKEKLLAAMDAGNVDKTQAAPVTVIIAEDEKFYDRLPTLFPHVDARSWFEHNAPLADATRRRNSSLQGAYFMLAARALGLDCGPMSGFDAGKLDAAFFGGTTWRSNFVCNLGYGDTSKLRPRLPRLTFDEACQLV
jgi:3-hydroxypropanoate dehydrogenase